MLAGTVEDSCRSYPHGTFIHVPAGEQRQLSSSDGADVFVFLQASP